MAMIERVPAVVCSVDQIKSGTYVEMPGWDPNFVIIDERLKVSRVNIIGVITLAATEGGTAQYTLSDGTGEIALRSYDSPEPLAQPGDLVLVIGRPRSYDNTLYLVPELIRSVERAWAEFRKREIEILALERASLPILSVEQKPDASAETVSRSAASTTAAAPEEEPSDTERIYAMIETLDSGDGADLSDIIARALSEGIENAEKAIHHMLEMGDIFEIRAGKLKVL